MPPKKPVGLTVDIPKPASPGVGSGLANQFVFAYSYGGREISFVARLFSVAVAFGCTGGGADGNCELCTTAALRH